jgi:hypothetical protein
MASAMKPGPVCGSTAERIDSGTMCRVRSPLPSSVGSEKMRLAQGAAVMDESQARGSSSVFPGASMLASLGLGAIPGTAVTAGGATGKPGGITLNAKLDSYRQTLLRTKAGKALLDNLQNNFTVLINDGTPKGKDALGETEQKEAPRQFTVTIDNFKMPIGTRTVVPEKPFDKYDAAELLYHELKAHVEGYRATIEEYHELYKNKFRIDFTPQQATEGFKPNPNSSARAQDQLEHYQRKFYEHMIYGAYKSPLRCGGNDDSFCPDVGHPAREIMDQLDALRKLDSVKSGKTHPQR